jgi:hypothetical protein
MPTFPVGSVTDSTSPLPLYFEGGQQPVRSESARGLRYF